METFYVRVCDDCESITKAYRREDLARIEREAHNRTEHGGDVVADVREYEHESMDTTRPVSRRQPTYNDFAEDGAEDDEDAVTGVTDE